MFLKTLFVLILIIMFAAHGVLPAANAMVSTFSSNQNIVVLSDASDSTSLLLGENLYRVISEFYAHTEKVRVKSFQDLETQLPESFIKIYAFRGSVEGMHVGSDLVPWKDFANLMNRHQKAGFYGPEFHIVASGDANLLQPYLEPCSGFLVEPSPVIDAKVSYFYSLWTTADILDGKEAFRTPEMREAGQSLRKSAILFFTKDFNDIVQRVIEPEEPMGETQPDSVSETLLLNNVSLTQVYPSPSTADSQNPILCLGSPNMLNAQVSSGKLQLVAAGNGANSSIGQGRGYVKLTNLALKSGVNGPVGKVVDVLLSCLNTKLGELGLPSEIGISESFVNETQNYLKQFTKWLNGTIVQWVNDNMDWIGTGAILTLEAVLVASYESAAVRAKLAELVKKITLACIQYVGELTQKLNNLVNNALPLKYDLKDVPVGFGDFNLFKFQLSLQIAPRFKIDDKALTELIKGIIFGDKDFTWESTLSVLSITPVFSVEGGIQSFGSDKNGIVKKLLDLCGLSLKFSGNAKFTMQLLKVNATLKSIEFIKIIEWSFKFSLELSKRFTVFDFFTAGAGGGVLAKAAEYIGLGHFFIDVFFRITVEIVSRAAEAGNAAMSKLIFEITLGMTLDLKVLIVWVKGGLEVTMRFIQDFMSDTPLEIFLILHLWFSVKIDLYALDFDVGKWDWWPLDEVEGSHKGTRIAGGTDSKELKDNAVGLDTDMDGLSDDFETSLGLNKSNTDTDGDGLNDKFELDVSRTDPNFTDTDGDGLNDGAEVNIYLTDPLLNDTDYDGLSDYDEVMYYHTSPLLLDTDKDGLSDYYEINTTYDFTGTRVTPSVPFVIINETKYYNHTDPLNPDTDGDGLLDGEEGVRIGTYYGNDSTGVDTNMLNFGYTHPLCYDTDSDSYEQYADGNVTARRLFYCDMNDGIEVRGQSVTFVNASTGETYTKVVHTNPCDPDTDNDTAEGAIYLNSDGRELGLTPPTDPTNGDSDGDGLLDGQEGTSDQHHSYHTDPNNPDTDGDGLCDGAEIKMNTNPLNPDTDGDGVRDGDEVNRYHTNPLLNDTDGDMLSDGEELLQFYSDPLVPDSDNDTIIDGYEAYIYGTDPVNPDTDGDGLTDNMEIFVYGTNPLSGDTDHDRISDWDEINVYHTNPLKWDTDEDSITALNETGQMTLSCGDYEELFMYHTDPLSSDSDLDGLADAQELFLALGSPGFAPIPLDPLNNDTDKDGLLDGAELLIETTCTFLYPYTAEAIQYPYNSSPVKNDTDRDGLLDGEEVLRHHTRPDMNDTDSDTLTDYDEVNIYRTSPTSNDTDGDDLADNVEIFGLSPLNGTHTDPLKSDTDNDLLPDAAELLHHTDPLNPDSDGDGIKDGAEFDTDGDGLNDGEEFYVYDTNLGITIKSSAHSGINITDLVGHPAYLFVGGFDNPDSDGDGLTDGVEVHVYHTNVTNADTDGDGFSDGEEVLRGTDPLSWTGSAEFLAPAEIHIYAYDRSAQKFINATCNVKQPDSSALAVWTNGDDGYGNSSMAVGNYTVSCSYSGVNASNSPQSFNLLAGKTKVVIFEYGEQQAAQFAQLDLTMIIILVSAGLLAGVIIAITVLRLLARRKNKNSSPPVPSKPETRIGGMT